MGKTTENTTTNNTTKTRKKISVNVLKTADLDIGGKIAGKFLKYSERPWLDKTTGEEKAIPQFLFEDANGDRFIVMGDAGFKNAVLSAGVSENDLIEVEKLDMVDLPGGRRVNQYDVFQLI